MKGSNYEAFDVVPYGERVAITATYPLFKPGENWRTPAGRQSAGSFGKVIDSNVSRKGYIYTVEFGHEDGAVAHVRADFLRKVSQASHYSGERRGTGR